MPSPSDLPLHEVHLGAGARFAARRDRPVVASYGDPAGEHAALRQGAALVDLPTRGVLEVAGPVRLKFLQGMLSNDVAGRPPGQGCRAAMLSARGSVHALVRALVEKDVVLLETDFDRVLPLQKALEFYRVAAPVRFAPRPVAVLALAGEEAEAVLRRAGIEAPAAAEAHALASLGGQPARVARAGDLPGHGFVVHASNDGVRDAWGALLGAGARPAGLDALDVRRIEALRPWWGDDVTEENILHETGLLPECVSFAKGCYVGQEIVARLDARGGHVNKALRGLRLEAPAQAGTTVTVGGKPVGRVTTAGVSPRLGPIALAYVHRDHFGAGTAVEAGGSPATVVTSFDEAGARG
ncbi:MAG TPA: glycine cleavage T C-terminal barrel domain-containing protein [Vicinamibacteria bacterium]|nr:glycine cleavage T C-terminal barrel domain-containing protein [Vicinamibacteria bacterium]